MFNCFEICDHYDFKLRVNVPASFKQILFHIDLYLVLTVAPMLLMVYYSALLSIRIKHFIFFYFLSCCVQIRAFEQFFDYFFLLADSMTHTVELNALCMKLGKKPIYKLIDPYQGMRPAFNYNIRAPGPYARSMQQ